MVDSERDYEICRMLQILKPVCCDDSASSAAAVVERIRLMLEKEFDICLPQLSQPARMAVLGDLEIILGGDGVAAEVPAHCIDLDRHYPSTVQELTAYEGQADVWSLQDGKWKRYGTLKAAIDGKVLTVRGTGRFDSIRFEKADRACVSIYAVKFHGNALFGTDSADIATGAEKVKALSFLEDRFERYLTEALRTAPVVELPKPIWTEPITNPHHTFVPPSQPMAALEAPTPDTESTSDTWEIAVSPRWCEPNWPATLTITIQVVSRSHGPELAVTVQGLQQRPNVRYQVRLQPDERIHDEFPTTGWTTSSTCHERLAPGVGKRADLQGQYLLLFLARKDGGYVKLTEAPVVAGL